MEARSAYDVLCGVETDVAALSSRVEGAKHELREIEVALGAVGQAPEAALQLARRAGRLDAGLDHLLDRLAQAKERLRLVTEQAFGQK